MMNTDSPKTVGLFTYKDGSCQVRFTWCHKFYNTRHNVSRPIKAELWGEVTDEMLKTIRYLMHPHYPDNVVVHVGFTNKIDLKRLKESNMKDEVKLEQEIQDKGLNAPRLTPEHVDATISDVEYHVFSNSLLTVCCITLKNGFTVTGQSACVSPENFDEKIGQDIAFENARDQIWQLEGYLLKEKLNQKTGGD